MKRIEDIEMMTPEELEKAALQEDIRVPEGLRGRMEAAIAAKELTAERKRPSRAWLPYAALAAAAAIAAVAVIPGRRSTELRDSFDDPYLAYAQVEATFRTISDKMAIGADLAAKAGETAEMPVQIIKNITK